MLNILSLIIVCSGPICQYVVPNTEFHSVERCKTLSPVIAGMVTSKSPLRGIGPRAIYFQCHSGDTGEVLFEFAGTTDPLPGEVKKPKQAAPRMRYGVS